MSGSQYPAMFETLSISDVQDVLSSRACAVEQYAVGPGAQMLDSSTSSKLMRENAKKVHMMSLVYARAQFEPDTAQRQMYRSPIAQEV